MIRFVLAVVLALALNSLAEAGCRNRYCQICYPSKQYTQKSVGWREAAAIIEKQQIEVDAFLAYQQRHAAAYQQTNVQVNGSPAYSASIAGTLSSYPVQGSTLYGQYGTNPVVQSAAHQQAYQRFLGMMIQGTHQGMMDQADLAKIEGEVGAEIAKINALGVTYDRMAAATRAQGEFRKLDFQMQFDPATQQVTVIQPGEQPPAEPAEFTFEALVASKCASCHSGQQSQGQVDLTGELTKELLGKAFHDVKDGKMPMVKDEQGNFVDGPDLSIEEQALFGEAFLRK